MALEIDLSELQKQIDKLQKLSEKDIMPEICQKTTLSLYNNLKNRTPVDTGYLRGQWTVNPIKKDEDGYICSVSNNTEYLQAVDKGRIVRQKKKGVETGVVYKTKGRYFIRKASNDSVATASIIAQKVIKRRLEELK